MLALRSLESLAAFFHAVSQCELSWIVFWSSSERPAARRYAPIDLTGIPWYRMDSYGSSLTAHYATNPSSFEIQKWKHMISSSPSHLLFSNHMIAYSSPQQHLQRIASLPNRILCEISGLKGILYASNGISKLRYNSNICV